MCVVSVSFFIFLPLCVCACVVDISVFGLCCSCFVCLRCVVSLFLVLPVLVGVLVCCLLCMSLCVAFALFYFSVVCVFPFSCYALYVLCHCF